MQIERNVGRVDQAIRVAMGLAMVSMPFWAPESGYWGLLGLLPLASAVTGFCPSYQLFGVRTNGRSDRRL